MIRAALSVARWLVSHYLVFPQFLSRARREKQDKSVHGSSSPRTTNYFYKGNPSGTRHLVPALFNRNGFVKKVKMELVGKDVQYSLLFPDIFVSVGGDKQDFSNLI